MKKSKHNPDPEMVRILILEDNPVDAELIERELRRARIGFASRQVEGKKEFSKALAEFQPQVILSDFKLPAFDGMAALDVARLRAPDIPFIFVSGSIGEEKAIELLAHGASDYIFKDNLQRMGPAVKRVVEEARLKREKKKTDLELQHRVEELRILAEAADRFVHINNLDEAYAYLSQTIHDISGASHLLLSLYDEKLQALRPKSVTGSEPLHETIRRRFHIDLMQMAFYLKDMQPDDFTDFVSRRLLPARDGLYGLANRKIPRQVCRAIEKLLAIDAMFIMGFSWENQLFGGVTVFFKKGGELKNAAQIEALVNLAAVAIKRLLAEKSLRDSEERFRRISETISDVSYSCLADPHGEYSISWMTGAIDRITGYSIEEAMAMKYWRKLVLEEDLPDFEKYVSGLTPGNSGICELRLRHKNGNTVWVQSFAECSQNMERPEQRILFGGLMDISERKRVENALRESEKKYRALVTQSPDGIFLVDLQGNFLSVNLAMCSGMKYSEAELLSMKIWDIVPKQYMDIHQTRLADILKGKATTEAAEYVVRGKDGETHQIDILSVPFYKDGKLIGFQGIARDVTEKKKMENRLRESEEYYRTLVETSPDAIIIVDGGAQVTFASRKTLDVFGIPAQTDMRGVSILDFVAPDEIPRVQERLVEILSGRSRPEIREYQLQRQNRRPFWADVSSAPLRDTSGRNIGLLLICRDVSERKKAETALRESEEKYRLIADNTAETITILDLDLHFTYVSPSILKLRGYTVEEASSQTLQQILTPDSFSKIRAVFNEEMALETSGKADPKRNRSLELQEYRKDGSLVWVENSLSFLRDGQGKVTGILVIAKNIDERKRAETEILKEKAFLEALVEAAPEGIAITDCPGLILQVNNEFIRMFGYAADEALGKQINDLVVPAELREEAQTITQAVGKGDIKAVETLRKRKDGSIFNVSLIGAPIFIAGRQVAVYAIYRDISASKRAEEQIRYQASLLQDVSDAIIATDKNNNIQIWNQAAERIYGWQAAEAVGKNFREMIRPEYRYTSRKEMIEKLEREGSWSGEIIHHLRDGKQIPIQSTITVLKDAVGIQTGTVSVNHDISERKAAEEQLRERDHLLRNLSAQVPGMIYTFMRRPDGTFCIPYSSNAIQDIFGVSPREVSDDASAIFKPILAEDRPNVIATIENSAQTLSPWKAEYRVQLPGEPVRWMLGQSDPVRLEDGSVLWYGFNTDITERKLAEELISTSLKEKEVLLQEIHHRVKNNLQIISGLLTLQADQAAGKSVEDIFRESQDRIRSIALIHEKLYQSRNMAEIAFDEYLHALVDNLLISHSIVAGRIGAAYVMERIHFTIEKAIPLGLIVNELVTNSLKHAFPADRRGTIRIELHGQKDAKFVGVKTGSGKLYRPPFCELVVADDGIGLPASQIPGQDKTLGMKLVSMLAKQIQGELKVKTGLGTEFRLLFPGSPTAAPVTDENNRGGA
jgi:PAS domain S-box-containing protein